MYVVTVQEFPFYKVNYTYGYPIFPEPPTKKIIFYSLNYLSTSTKFQQCVYVFMYACVYIYGSISGCYSVPLIYLSTFAPISHHLNTLIFKDVKSDSIEALTLLFFCKVVLARFFAFPNQFYNQLGNSYKKAAGTVLNLGRTDTLM